MLNLHTTDKTLKNWELENSKTSIWEQLKNDKEQQDIYKDNASFTANAFLKHEKEMAKLNK